MNQESDWETQCVYNDLKTDGIVLTAVLYSLAEQHAHGVDNAGRGGAVHPSAQRQQETSLGHKSEALANHSVASPALSAQGQTTRLQRLGPSFNISTTMNLELARLHVLCLNTR